MSNRKRYIDEGMDDMVTLLNLLNRGVESDSVVGMALHAPGAPTKTIVASYNPDRWAFTLSSVSEPGEDVSYADFISPEELIYFVDQRYPGWKILPMGKDVSEGTSMNEDKWTAFEKMLSKFDWSYPQAPFTPAMPGEKNYFETMVGKRNELEAKFQELARDNKFKAELMVAKATPSFGTVRIGNVPPLADYYAKKKKEWANQSVAEALGIQEDIEVKVESILGEGEGWSFVADVEEEKCPKCKLANSLTLYYDIDTKSYVVACDNSSCDYVREVSFAEAAKLR